MTLPGDVGGIWPETDVPLDEDPPHPAVVRARVLRPSDPPRIRRAPPRGGPSPSTFAAETRWVHDHLVGLDWERLHFPQIAFLTVHALFLSDDEAAYLFPDAFDLMLRSQAWAEAYGGYISDLRRRRLSHHLARYGEVFPDLLAAVEARFRPFLLPATAGPNASLPSHLGSLAETLKVLARLRRDAVGKTK